MKIISGWTTGLVLNIPFVWQRIDSMGLRLVRKK